MKIFSKLRKKVTLFKKKETAKKPVWISSMKKNRGIEVKKRKVSLFFKVVIKEILKNKYIKFFLSVTLLCILIIFIRYLLFSPNFNIKNINIDGCQNVERDFVFSRVERIMDKNIFFVRSSNLSKEIRNYSAYIADVRVEKHLPDNVDIVIEEREPVFIWVNLSGAYLISQEGLVLEVVSDFKNLNISSEDIDLLKGYGNLKEYTESEEDDEDGDEEELEEAEPAEAEEDSFEEEELSNEDILELIEQEKSEIISRVDQYWSENMSKIPEKFQIYTYVFSYDQSSFVSLDRLNEDILDDTKVGLDIDFIGEDVHRYIWESEYRFVFFIDMRRKIIFSTRRDFSMQADDLRILLENLKRDDKKFSYIDLSSDIIVYEVEE